MQREWRGGECVGLIAVNEARKRLDQNPFVQYAHAGHRPRKPSHSESLAFQQMQILCSLLLGGEKKVTELIRFSRLSPKAVISTSNILISRGIIKSRTIGPSKFFRIEEPKVVSEYLFNLGAWKQRKYLRAYEQALTHRGRE